MIKPVIALVGRPNVGKSTLFNRLAGERLAVVDEVPGTTRDRLVAEMEWRGIAMDIVDTGGIDPTDLRRKEPLSVNSADYIDEIRTQAEQAARDADAIIFLVDGETGLTAADEEVASILRRGQSERNGEPWPPIIVAVNKCENEERRVNALEFYAMGLGDPFPISALHGTGTGDLLDKLFDSMKLESQPFLEDEEDVPKIAIVGKPNVGKSSLLNKLLGEERVIVSPIPGTTRDAIDTTLKYHGQKIILIDTAGIRRRGRIEPGVEKFSVLRTVKAIDRADIVLLLIDATEGVTAQDAHIAGMVVDKMKSVVVVVNKWDAILKDTSTMPTFTDHVRSELKFLDYVPVLFISAKTGQRVGQVLPMALRVQEERYRRIPTAELNRLIRNAMDSHAPPSKAGKRLRIYFTTQVRTDPPTFLFHVNDPKLAHFSYIRFLENRIRDVYGFLGTPLRLSFRPRS
ncbi:MAG: ribosome biogenesis GTPase Der [Anaerolineales bacterium]|nr:ribosome biogenesis GTPase Der [Anaerolineales bacterium]